MPFSLAAAAAAVEEADVVVHPHAHHLAHHLALRHVVVDAVSSQQIENGTASWPNTRTISIRDNHFDITIGMMGIVN